MARSVYYLTQKPDRYVYVNKGEPPRLEARRKLQRKNMFDIGAILQRGVPTVSSCPSSWPLWSGCIGGGRGTRSSLPRRTRPPPNAPPSAILALKPGTWLQPPRLSKLKLRGSQTNFVAADENLGDRPPPSPLLVRTSFSPISKHR